MQNPIISNKAVWPVLGLVFFSTAPLPPAETVEKANSVERIVRFELRVVNRGDTPQDLKSFLALPWTNERQEVLYLLPEPGCREISTDAYGNRIAVYVDPGVRPGEVRTHGWMAAVRLHAAVYKPAGAVPPLSAEEKERYTRDSPNYQIRSPYITALRDSLTRGCATEAEKVAAIFKHIVSRIRYVRDDKWDPAPIVIEKGEGSCSEYNYALIALLRSCGIPCRYTGAVILTADNTTRYDEKVHEDAVFHRWTEVFLRETGWFPLDGSRASGAQRKFDNILNYWGRLPAGSLQTFRGDGGDDLPLEWQYVARAQGKAKGSLKASTVAYWIDAPVSKLEPELKAAEKAISGEPSAESLGRLLGDSLKRECLFFWAAKLERKLYPSMAQGLLDARHPQAIYFSLSSVSRGEWVPEKLFLARIADEALRSQIEKQLGPGARDWATFEYWWRKARPQISFSPEKGAFVLGVKEVGVH